MTQDTDTIELNITSVRVIQRFMYRPVDRLVCAVLRRAGGRHTGVKSTGLYHIPANTKPRRPGEPGDTPNMVKHLRADVPLSDYKRFKSVKINEDCSTNDETITLLLDTYEDYGELQSEVEELRAQLEEVEG